MNSKNTITSLSVLSGCLVFGLAVGAFVLSYDTLKHVAEQHGINPNLVWVWPLILDGAIVVFSVSALRCSLTGENHRYPMALVIAATGVSIVFNALHGDVGWMGRIMASIPPLVLFLSFELLLRHLQFEVTKMSNNETIVQDTGVETLDIETADTKDIKKLSMSHPVFGTSGQETSGQETSGQETSDIETSGQETSGQETSDIETSGQETSGQETSVNGPRQKRREYVRDNMDMPNKDIADLYQVSCKTISRDKSWVLSQIEKVNPAPEPPEYATIYDIEETTYWEKVSGADDSYFNPASRTSVEVIFTKGKWTVTEPPKGMKNFHRFHGKVLTPSSQEVFESNQRTQ